MKKILDKTFFLYVGLGILNYLTCNAIMLVVHNVFHVAKTPSLILEFALQTMISFLLNRYVTFRGIPISRYWPLKFVVSVGASYLLAKVLLLRLFEEWINLPFFAGISDWLQGLIAKEAATEDFRRNLVMLATTFIYCVVNYIGQRYYVFSPRKQDTGNPPQSGYRTSDGSAPDPMSAQGST